MPRTKKGSPPKYRHYKRTGQAVTTIDGVDHYLGDYGSPSSKEKYGKLIIAWESQQQDTAEAQDAPPAPKLSLVRNHLPTMNELILVYLKHVYGHYRDSLGRDREAGCIDGALKVIQACGYGREPVASFRPKDLKTVRQAMIAKGWSRGNINHQILRVRRMFKFAVAEDMIPPSVLHAIREVDGLRKGTPGVKEGKRVKPAPLEHIKAVLEKSQQILKRMIRFAYHTGARPGETCALKPCYLDQTKKIWVYTVPADANKVDVHDQERKIFLGPKAQKSLRPFLEGLDPNQFVFSPIRETQLRIAAAAAARKTKRTPSELKRLELKNTREPKIKKGESYDAGTFRQAIIRICDKLGIPRWAPNRLRHNAATRFRKKYGIEVARILLGHRRLNTTEVYAETDQKKAKRAAAAMG